MQLSISLVDYILDLQNVVYKPNDIPYFEVRNLVQQLMQCTTTASMNILPELGDIRVDSGYSNAAATIEDRDILIYKHNIITKQLEDIQQFTIPTREDTCDKWNLTCGQVGSHSDGMFFLK